jgi:hypothetical protein
MNTPINTKQIIAIIQPNAMPMPVGTRIKLNNAVANHQKAAINPDIIVSLPIAMPLKKIAPP